MRGFPEEETSKPMAEPPPTAAAAAFSVTITMNTIRGGGAATATMMPSRVGINDDCYFAAWHNLISLTSNLVRFSAPIFSLCVKKTRDKEKVDSWLIHFLRLISGRNGWDSHKLASSKGILRE